MPHSVAPKIKQHRALGKWESMVKGSKLSVTSKFEDLTYSLMILFKNICIEYLQIAESKSVVFFF